MASSSSSHVLQMKYDVFISFRGSDTRHGFLSHLKKGLHQKQIDAYVDERLERGDGISSALLKAIERSEISLIIFSEDYASSKWCLEELVKIIECMEVNGQIVIPVFYNTDPSDVRHQKGTYGNAFAIHEQKLKDNVKKVQNWRSALNQAANLSGYHYSSNSEKDESKLVDEIVKDVLKKLDVLEKLDDIYPIQLKGFVGIDQNFACIVSLLQIESKEVRILGIWGMGGIGKTTLAHAICDKFSTKYESCCFLENVREECKKVNGVKYLLHKLLSVLLKEEISDINDVVKARSYKRRLCRIKVLIVLDDVDTSEQLEKLVEEPFLGPGSRVIITSRNKHVLTSKGVHAIYKVEELNFAESVELFSLNAFNQSHPKMEYKQLSERAVSYAKGIPLALKVLGSYFHSKNIEIWESALKKLQKYPKVEIQNVLRVSYDGLDDAEKDIFLDIALFFKGERENDVIRIMDACGFYAASGIDSLKDKALVTISTWNHIEMHDLIQKMGEQIVHEECVKDPGRRSRLREFEEIYDVLKNNKGTEVIEGIALNMCQNKEISEIQLSANTFKKMTNLRFLKFYCNWYKRPCNVKLPFGLESFSDKLRYFHWEEYPLESLPLNFCAEKLVEFRMKHSNVKKLWDGVQELVNLKTIDLSGSFHLLELPDFSKARKLEQVDLSHCINLSSVHRSILSSQSLVFLSVNSCSELKSLQSEVHLKSLACLNVDRCYGLQKFSLSSEKLTELDLTYTRMKTLQSSIGRNRNVASLYLNCSALNTLPINGLSCLRFLQRLRFYDCKHLIDKAKLHILFGASPFLRHLYLEKCSNLFELPDNFGDLSGLEYLSLIGCSAERLPASIKDLSNLQTVELRDCDRLRFELDLPPFIRNLYVDNCKSLETVLASNTRPQRENAEVEYFISFKNCKKLNEHQFSKEFARFFMRTATSVEVLYTGSRVPEWFGYNRTTGASITVEIAPTRVYCLILCVVVSPHISNGDSHSSLGVTYYRELEEYPLTIQDIRMPFEVENLNSDHVILWKFPFDLSVPLNNTKVSFEFYMENIGITERANGNPLIKECGVYPIYDSEYHNFTQQMELKSKLGKKTKMIGTKQIDSDG